MKTLLKIFLAICLLSLAAALALYLVVTNPGFQKSQIEKRLPEGSSLDFVKVTLGSAKIEGLVVALPDGTKVKLAALETTFSPLSAVFGQKIEMGSLQVEGLLVNLSSVLMSPQDASAKDSKTLVEHAIESDTDKISPSSAASAQDQMTSLADALYAVENIKWIFDIENIEIEGALRDAGGTSFDFELDSDPIKPGKTSEVKAQLKLASSQALQASLSTFQATTEIRLSQKAEGGFDLVQVKSEILGADSKGTHLISLSQNAKLEIDGFSEKASLSFELAGEVPQPEIFVSDLADLGPLRLGANFKAEAVGQVFRLEEAEGFLQSKDKRVAELVLKQSLILEGAQNLTGELLDLRLSEIPLNWMNPFLGQGLFIEGAPFSLALTVFGEAGGVTRVTAFEPVVLGPLSLTQDEASVLSETSLSLDPVIEFHPDGSMQFSLGQIRLSDRYGAFVEASAQGVVKKGEQGANNLLQGISMDASVRADLPSLLGQPFVKDQFALLDGDLNVSLKVDHAEDFPIKVMGNLEGLRTTESMQTRDYQFAAQIKESASGALTVETSLRSGPEARPSTSVAFMAEFFPGSQPLRFDAVLKGERMAQSDLQHLAVAFSPKQPSSQGPEPMLPGMEPKPKPVPTPAAETGPIAPPWASLNGTASVEVDEIYLDSGQAIKGFAAKAVVSEPLLALEKISAGIGTGSLSGKGEVAYNQADPRPYSLTAALEFSEIDPAIFAKPNESFPIRGIFDGELSIQGDGLFLEETFQNAEGSVLVTGKEGVVTAFELKGKLRAASDIIGIASLFTDDKTVQQANLVNQVVPYFQQIRFDDFSLQLNRGADKKIVVPELKIAGDFLLIDASGFVEATQFDEVLNQPMKLSLQLGSKGKLAEHLDKMQLLQPQGSETGDYRLWNKKLNISGTLSNPDTSEVTDLLTETAGKLFSKEKSPATVKAEESNLNAEPAPAKTKEKTKAERRAEEIKMGLDLINSVFGN